jgi:hypothetical protein
MASSSTTTNPLLAHPVTEKLNKLNHALWHAQVRAAIRGARLLGFLTAETKAPPANLTQKGADGKDTEIPEYEDWEASGQQPLSYLLSSLSKEILIQVSSAKTAAEAWNEIQGMFASQTRARNVNVRLALGNTRKGESSISEYIGKMKALGEQMAAAGRPLEEEELVQYILTGLDEEYTPFVSAVCARTDPISISKLFAQLLNFETYIGLFSNDHQRSVNTAGRG